MDWASQIFTLPSAREPGLLRAQYRSLTRLVPVMYGVILAVVAMLIVDFHANAPIWLSVYTPAAMSVPVALRAVQWLRARRHADTLAPADMVRACRKVTILGPALSFGFALIGLALREYGDPTQQSLVIMMIWVLAVISGFCLYSVPVAALSVVLATTLPMLAAFSLSNIAVVAGLVPVFAVVTALILYMLIEIYRNFATIVRANQELTASETRIHHLAYHDPLTGLANRLRLAELLERDLQMVGKSGQTLAVCCVDLDRFKEVNDTFGHAAGDDLIRAAARLLRSACASGDTIARLGGDEFAIVRPCRSRDEADAFAGGLVGLLSNAIDLAVGRVFIGCSVGVCLVTEPVDAPECLRRADLALYRAKEQGRGRHVFFDQDMDATLRLRVQLRDDLREALDQQALTVVYQPQVRHGSIFGAEALARWNHPVRGTISPSVFIPIAEESGLIDRLGAFVLRQVFEDSRRAPGLRLSVNVSGAQIRNREFPTLLSVLIKETAVDPTAIEIEITEGVLLGDDPEILRTLERIRELGFRIALDDFGTGYSSLSYLRRYPIDKIKIDRSFVANLGLEPEADAVVGAIIRLARALRLDVIAEGVETDMQRLRLAALGCGDIQGYLVGRPMPLRDLLDPSRAAA